VSASMIPSYTIVGRPGSWLESFNANVYLVTRWNRYQRFFDGAAADDRQADFSTGLTLRGGWQVGVAWSIETFGYPASLYTDYWIERTRGSVTDTIPFTGTPRIPNLDFAASLATPNFQTFSLTASLLAGHDENFFEWASGHLLLGSADLVWRPTARWRAELLYQDQEVRRPSDGSIVSRIRVPRLKIEYQLSRPVFIRLIGQYTANETDALRDDSRTNGAILIRDPATGAFTRTMRSVSNLARLDWLFSYHPTPGTVAYVGYGNSLEEQSAFAFRSLARVSDGFFVKLSYLFHVGR